MKETTDTRTIILPTYLGLPSKNISAIKYLDKQLDPVTRTSDVPVTGTIYDEGLCLQQCVEKYPDCKAIQIIKSAPEGTGQVCRLLEAPEGAEVKEFANPPTGYEIVVLGKKFAL